MEKVTQEWIDGEMLESTATFQRIEGTTVTICVITLPSGFCLVGDSACINPADYDEEVGQKIAFENAREQLWALEGYRRKSAGYLM